MSEQNITLKRHNHRVHPCPNEKKEALLKLLLEKNVDKNIFVVTAAKSELTSQQANVTFLSDEELNQSPELQCDLLISYDLPLKSLQYMNRLSHTTTYALVLVNSSEEKLLHPIETLIGRTIMQENIEGFSEVKFNKQAQPVKKDSKEERKRKFLADDMDDEKSFKSKSPYDTKKKKPWSDKAKISYDDSSEEGEKKSWDKKPKKENKYLGRDESGKAKFSGKSGERNHHFDGTPKGKETKLTGKKINIKDMKKGKEEK